MKRLLLSGTALAFLQMISPVIAGPSPAEIQIDRAPLVNGLPAPVCLNSNTSSLVCNQIGSIPPGGGFNMSADNLILTVPGGQARKQSDVDQDQVNVASFGAFGANGVDYTAAFQAAFTAAAAQAKGVHIPCGSYIISSPVDTAGVSMQGDGKECVRIFTNILGSTFLIKVPASSIVNRTYGGFQLDFYGPSNNTGSAYASGFEITGGVDGGEFSSNLMQNIRFNGFYAAVKVSKPSFVTSFGYEEPFNVNTFRNIDVDPYGTVTAAYGIWTLGGSGTGNLYDRFTGSMGIGSKPGAVLRFEGSCVVAFGCVPVAAAQVNGGNVVGDYKQSNNDVSNATFLSVGAGSVYNDNQGFVGTQFDGDVPPLSYDNPPAGGLAPRGIRTCSTNMGGNGMNSKYPVQGSIICDRDSMQVLTGSISTGITTLSTAGNGANQVRGIELHLAPNTATMIEVTMQGGGFQASTTPTATDGSQYINGSGGLAVTSKYLVQRGTGPVSFSQIPNSCFYKNADGKFGACGAAATGAGTSTAQQLQINAYVGPSDDANAMGFNPLFFVQSAATAAPYPTMETQLRAMGGNLYMTR